MFERNRYEQTEFAIYLGLIEDQDITKGEQDDIPSKQKTKDS